MIEITNVYTSDWEGYYIDDELVCEGHRVDTSEIIEYLKDGYDSFEKYEISGQWIHLEGSLPQSLIDLKAKDQAEEYKIDKFIYESED